MEGFVTSVSSRLVRGQIISPDDADVFIYGLDLILFTGLTKVALLLFGCFVGRLPQTLIYTCSFSILQAFGGGYHASTHARCFIITSAFWAIAMLLAHYLPPMAHIFLLTFGVCTIFTLAPIENINAPMNNQKKRKMRRYSRVACLSFIAISIPAYFFVFDVFAYISIGVFLSGISKILAFWRS